MKTRLIGGIFAALFVVSHLLAEPREEQWKKVEHAVHNGLPKTAIEELQPIIADALASKSYAEAIKAISEKIVLEGNIQGGKPEEKISRMQAELANAPLEMRPVMEAILAHWYWHYFQQNRWRFMQRTATAATPGADIETWDLARILAEIDHHFMAALSDEHALKATPITDYNGLLQLGDVPDDYRPTLFDFLSYDALEFYQAGEQAASKTEDEFELDATASPIFASAAEFADWRPPTKAETSPIGKAIRIYQALLKFHEADADRSAFYDADLARLDYGHNVAVGENKDDLYKTGLHRLIDATAGHEIFSRALATLAEQTFANDEPAQARELAQRGLNAFPSSAGGARCFNVIQQIEQKSAQLETERVWNAPWPTLNVRYRNVTKIYFRAVAVNFDDYVNQSRWNFGVFNESQRQELLAAKPALEWSADLSPTVDYKWRTEKLPAPTTLKPGLYLVFSGYDHAFHEERNEISVAPVWVSDLALVCQFRDDGRPSGGFLLKAKSGEPVAGATVWIWQRDSERWAKADASAKTDENGRFEIQAMNHEIVLLAEHDGQAVSTSRGFWNPRDNRKQDSVNYRTVFFTDRALYRPGQTISYKGVSIRYDQAKGEYSSLARRTLTVVFNDPNGKEIARTTHKTNDYGSFSGVFIAPRDRLMGQMTLAVEGSPDGRTRIGVEEYKRPKFQVELNAPTAAPKLVAPVIITGKATAYTGASLGGAKVKWRVERGVQMPYWCWWWEPPSVKAIAHGIAVTEPDGTFKIQFDAEPDRSVPPKNEPTFVFTVRADVTDTSGETRSVDRPVRVGYTALQASVSADEWQLPDKPVEFTIETKSLDGDPQPASGTLTLSELNQPEEIERSPWVRQLDAEDPAVDRSNPESWRLGQTAGERQFETDAAGKALIAVRLKAGIYRASLQTKDQHGETATARKIIQVVDPGERNYRVKQPNYFASPNWSVAPGDKFVALWGTGYETGRAFVQIECAGQLLASYWTAKDRTQELIEFPITEAMRGGVTLRVTYVRENRAYLNERIVNVPWSNKKLAVKWESFRSKLTPGQKETWTAVVTGPDAKRCVAEMVAALYDASLDQYLPLRWPREFNVFRGESYRVNTEFQNANVDFRNTLNWRQLEPRAVNWNYRTFSAQIVSDFFYYSKNDETIVLSPFTVASASDEGYNATSTLAGTRIRTDLEDVGASISVVTGEFTGDAGAKNTQELLKYATNTEVGGLHSEEGGAAGTVSPEPDLGKVAARKNLNETAFFFPHLLADDKGEVKMVFSIPEALTEWRFLAFAHDKNLRAGFLTDKIVTAKDLMVEPNPPRFVREGDTIEFTAKVSNQTDQTQTGKVMLTFADAASLKSVDRALGNRTAEQTFDIPAKQSRSYSWRIAVPDGMGYLTYKVVGASTHASDGEEGFLPVLSRRILVTESLPLPIRGKSTKQFEFKKLLDSGQSATLRHESLTVQMVSKPAWYAVMALPYLMEYPYECSEQVFNRFYANALARHIANSDPKIRRVFDLWKATSALESPLDKNQDLKSVMLEETPWLRQSKAESEARRNVGVLFDANRLDEEASRALHSLSDRQLSQGLWSWFPGGYPSEYISLYIATGFGRLRHLGVDVDIGPAVKSLDALDRWEGEQYRQILKLPNPENYVPSYIDAFYLYGRSFFLQDRPIAKENRDALAGTMQSDPFLTGKGWSIFD